MSPGGVRNSGMFTVTVMAMHMCSAVRVSRNPASPNLPLADFEVLCELPEEADCKSSDRALRV